MMSCRVFAVVLAAVVPHLDLMIALLGAFASSALALVFPPLFHVISLWPDQLGRCKWVLVKDSCIMLVGLLAFVTGSAATLVEIVRTFYDVDS